MPVPDIIHVSLMFLAVYSHASSSSCNAQDVRRSEFPDNFLFGTAISSYQVEGGFLEDGKGLSNWDVFSHIHGNIKNNENGDIADDNYHRFLEDAEIAHSLGVNAYRFSISWARILPRGMFGEVNPGGIEFYNKVIDSLLLRGIEPFVTIHHFDHPQELGDRYGAWLSWLSPLMQVEFVLLAEICFKSFGDRPMPRPLSYTENDFSQSKAAGYLIHWYLETTLLKCAGTIGVNCQGFPLKKLSGDHFIRGFAYTTGERDGILIGEPTGVDRFYVVPRGMEKIVDHVSKRYKNIPIYVTENGYSPPLAVPNLLHDVHRIEFHKGYLAALARAIRKGADVRGYFIWSLMDNFEWAGGYSSRFGLYRVDRATMKRTPKLSAKWFQNFLANRHIMIAGTEANATVM
ncbi:hypothetical protein V6N12_003898 [Hibiscus sabdariffa]|uniref:Beta-glucosidase n=1 Tax=Hibiscus sabdariffa TaxID=183260 RepID=A0ABR2CJX6_9ROSI